MEVVSGFIIFLYICIFFNQLPELYFYNHLRLCSTFNTEVMSVMAGAGKGNGFALEVLIALMKESSF